MTSTIGVLNRCVTGARGGRHGRLAMTLTAIVLGLMTLYLLTSASAEAALSSSPTAVRDASSGYQWVYYINDSGGISAWVWTGSWPELPLGLPDDVEIGTSPVVI